jgi:nucleoid-associated protein YgaU
MLAGSVSLGLAASGVVAVAAPALRVPVAAAQTSTSTTSTTPTSVPPATVTMHRLGPGEPLVEAPAPAPDLVQVAADRWTVKPGECFWSIADEVLTARLGRVATDAEIVPYWKRLIETNRHQLVQRDNPDLIIPAQVFVIPSP